MPRFSAAPDVLTWRRWHDEWVVYDERTAKTHLLVDSAGAVLQEVLQAREPLSIPDIWHRLFADGPEVEGGAAPMAAEHQSLESLLTEFVRLGLIERQCP